MADGRHPTVGRRFAARAAAAAFPGEGQAHHSHLSEWRPVAGRHVRSQAVLAKYDGQPLPSRQPDDRTAHRRGDGVAVQVRTSTARAASRSARSSPRPRAHVDDICFIRSMHANTPNHEQSMRLMNCGDERLSRPSMGAWLTYGLGTENAEPAGLHRHVPRLAGGGRFQLAVGVLARRLSGHAPRHAQDQGRGTDREHHEPLGHASATSGGNWICLPAHQPPASGRSDRTNRNWKPASKRSSWPIACRRRRPTPSTSRASPQHILDAYGDTVHGRQLLHGPAARSNAASASCSATTATCSRGTATTIRQEPPQSRDANATARIAALAHRPQAARPVRRNARHLRRRIRPHAGRGTGQRQAGRRARSQPLGLHRLARRRRRERRHSPTAPPTSSATARSRIRCTSTTCTPRSCTCSASTTRKLTYRHAGRDFRLTDVHGEVVREIVI